MGLLETISRTFLGDPIQRNVKRFESSVAAINALEERISALSDADLKAKTDEFKAQLGGGADINTLLAEAFAVVREASKRVLGMRHFDVQLIGGMAMHEGSIAEMKTGEGKTLVSTLPAYLNALEEKGVYVVTVNDYLAKRDKEWMGPVFEFLGVSVGLIQAGMNPDERLKAYACDITYGTNNEFGFDYLRDNLSWDIEQCCQTRRHFAIIDEVDSILVDEARTPLIISGPVQDSTKKYVKVSRVAKKLVKDEHFTIEEKHKNIVLTEDGISEVEAQLKIDNVYSIENMALAHMMVQCLKALHLFNKDIDYVVKDKQVMIVDEFTGRILDGRRYSDGLHQAIEAIEGLPIKQESQTLASITYQNYFRMFPKICGMTGTAKTEEEEFQKIYGLSVVQIPTNKALLREDMGDVVFKNRVEKFKAIAKNIEEVHKTGQPILAGTISIESSEYLSGLLKKLGIPHNVLNAKHHEKEAEIISNAGAKGGVTIATNMAGRGTDIVLGEGVKELGGLYVIGTSRHESRRIDNQLRGRSGRQGDPGKSKFYVALDDDIMRLFGSDRIARVMEMLRVPDDTPIENSTVSKSIERAQAKVEKYHFGVRKQILQYDDVMNRQRLTIYDIRHQILSSTSYDERVSEMLAQIIPVLLAAYASDTENPENNDIKQLGEQLQAMAPIKNIQEVLDQAFENENPAHYIQSMLLALYKQKKARYPEGLFDQVVAKRAILSTLDRKWMDHLHNMDILRDGIGLRAYGQRDPLMEYKKEGFDMFQELLSSIAEDALAVIFKTEIVLKDEQELPESKSKS